MTRHRVALALAGCLFTVAILAGAAGARPQPASGEPLLGQGRRLATQVDLALDFPHLLELRGGGRRANLELEDESLSRVLAQLAVIGGFEIDRSRLSADRQTTLVARNSTVASALATLARSEQLWFEIEDRQRLVVHEVMSIGERGPVPTRIHYVEPQYPPQASADGIQGKVLLEGVIGLDGGIERVAITGSAHPLLDEAARESVRQWQWEPVLVDGEPAKARVEVTVAFELH